MIGELCRLTFSDPQDELVLHMERDTGREEIYILYRDTRPLMDKPAKQKKEWVEWEAIEYAGGSDTVEIVQS